MTRAEERALEAYPIHKVGDSTLPYGEWDLNGVSRRGYQEGYEQAEKDLELTWEDMRAIRIIKDHLTASINGPMWDSKEFYEEILRRFKAIKEEKK